MTLLFDVSLANAEWVPAIPARSLHRRLQVTMDVEPNVPVVNELAQRTVEREIGNRSPYEAFFAQPLALEDQMVDSFHAGRLP